MVNGPVPASANVMVGFVGTERHELFAAVIALRSDPAPESAVVVTTNGETCAEAHVEASATSAATANLPNVMSCLPCAPSAAATPEAHRALVAAEVVHEAGALPGAPGEEAVEAARRVLPAAGRAADRERRRVG